MENKFYVYLHRRKDNNVVFYIGKGSGDRLKTIRKYKSWRKVYEDAGGFTYEIFKDNLSEKEALDLESQLIEKPENGWCLVNKRKEFKPVKISFDEVNDLVEYDETSETCLRYKKWNNSKINKTSRHCGDVAGYVVNKNSPPPYYTVKLNSKPCLVHRVVWILHHKEIPDGFVINHKNNNSLDNRIDNLEVVLQSVNSKRSKKSLDEHCGVFLSNINGYDVMMATITSNGKKVTKSFTLSKYGEHAITLAKNFRRIKLFELQSEGYKTNDDHETIEILKKEYEILYQECNRQDCLTINVRDSSNCKYKNIVCSWTINKKREVKSFGYSDNFGDVIQNVKSFIESKKSEYESCGLKVNVNTKLKGLAVP